MELSISIRQLFILIFIKFFSQICLSENIKKKSTNKVVSHVEIHVRNKGKACFRNNIFCLWICFFNQKQSPYFISAFLIFVSLTELCFPWSISVFFLKINKSYKRDFILSQTCISVLHQWVIFFFFLIFNFCISTFLFLLLKRLSVWHWILLQRSWNPKT